MADRSVFVKLGLTDSGFSRGLASASAKAKAFANDLDSVDNRMSGIVQTGLALGPALVPLAAVGAPAAAGLASGLTAVAAGAGAAALAFSGVGDALEAVNDYQLEPTAENLAAMQQALTELGPAGADFVRYLQSLRPELDGLQSIARQGLLPGVEEGIEAVRTQLPILEGIVGNVSVALGDMAREGGEALAGPFWTDFLQFVRDDAASALTGMGEGFLNIAEGMAGLTMAMDPLADDFGSQLLGMSEAFSRWGREVGQTEGFREFVDYLQGVGPQIAETLGAIGNMVVQFAEAAAPVGQVVLVALEGIANGLAAIANIPVVGPALIGAAAGVAALSRAVALWKASGIASMVAGLRGIDAEGKKASATMTAVGRGGLALTGLLVGIGIIENIGRALDETLPGLNELQNQLMGLSQGGQLASEFDSLGSSIDRIVNPTWGEAATDWLDKIGLPTETEMRRAQAELGALDTALAQIATTKGPLAAREAFQGLVQAQNLTAKEARQLIELLPGYRDAMAGLGSNADIAAEGLSAAERAAQNLNRELANLSANLEKRAAFRAYRDAIRNFNQVLKEGPENLRRGSAAWDQAMGALDGIAAASVTAAQHLRGLNKIEFMQQARRDFITAAKQMDLTGAQARQLADRLGLVNQKGKINVHLRAQGLDKATQDLRRVKDAAEDVPRNIDARVKGDTRDAERDLSVVAKKLRDLDNDQAVPETELKDNASRDINSVDRLMRDLDGRNANPQANLRDNASGDINRVGGLLGALDRDSANPNANLNDNATGPLSSIASRIAALDGRRATVTIETREITTQVTNVLRNVVPGASAEGNIFAAYGAGGDVPNGHQPMIAPGRPMPRVWAEEETRGESYIPHADDHRRPRAIDIWEATGRILGVDFVRLNALGGLYGAQSFQGGGFVGGAAPITSRYLEQRLDIVEDLPSLRAYNRALRQRARTLREVRRERRQLKREQEDAKEAAKALEQAERALDKAEKKGARQEAREALKEARREDRRAQRDARRAEKQLEDAKDAHAKAQDRVTDAVRKYADAQQQAIDTARQTAGGIMGTGGLFGGPFVEAESASERLSRVIANAEEFQRILARLGRRGASPFILQELLNEGPTRQAIAFGRQLLREPLHLRNLNIQTAQLMQIANRTGAMVADPSFLQPWSERRVDRMAEQRMRSTGDRHFHIYGVTPEHAYREAARQEAFSGVG